MRDEPAPHPREAERLAALIRYEILDTPRERDFDDLAELAAEICGTPIGVVNLIAADRQWFKAETGLGVRETPLETSFCAHAILEQDFLLVPDAAKDARFAGNPLVTGVPGLRFYAAALLRTPDGLPLGTLCVLDTKVRSLHAHQIRALRRLAGQAMAQLELRRALRGQAAAHARLRAILESATDDAIIATDPAGRITHWSRGATQLLGWDEAAALGQDAAIVFTPEDRAAGLPARERAAADAEGRASGERLHLRQDGSRFFGQGVLTPLPTQAGMTLVGLPDPGGSASPTGYLKILRDRTAQRAAERNFELIAETLPALIGFFDRHVTYRFVNRAFEDWFAMPAAALLGRTVREVLGADVYALRRPFIERALAGEHLQFDIAVTDAQGRLRHMAQQYVPRLGADGMVDGFYLLAFDITERTRLERELRELNGSLAAQVRESVRQRDQAWTHAQDLLAVVGNDGVFRAANPAWTRLLGWPAEELVGRSIIDLVHPDDRSSSRAALAAATRDVLPNFQIRCRHRDGSDRWIAWVAAPEGSLIYANGRDVTDERARQAELATAQDQLRQAQKMEAVGQLTGGVAHDFNNLLTIIRSSAELLRRPDLAEDRRRRYVDAIADTVDRAARLTGQLLAFARRQALKPEVFEVRERIDAVGDMLRTVLGARVRLSIESADPSCRVEADRSQFETAVVNMVVNARDAMNGEGTLRIGIGVVAAIPPCRDHAGNGSGFVAVSIADSGAGIPADQLPHIFEPFFTTKEVGKGTGLGLSQVYGFAKQSGGDVAVASEVGRGTTFTLYLPQASRAVTAVAAPRAGPAPLDSGDGRRVLVVEDNAEVGAFSMRLLRDLGYETGWASTAAEALTMIEQAQGGFDAVFSDVVMPGMSGVQLGLEVRRRYPGLPVVLTSGYSHVLAEEGLHGFELLRKPYAIEELSAVLGSVARAPRRPSAGLG